MDIEYVAQWEKLYTVSYLPGENGDFTAVTYKNLEAGSDTPTAPEPTAKAGYTFDSWSPSISPTVTGDAVYTATYTQDLYSVTYEPGTRGTFTAVTTPNLTYGTPTPEAPKVTGQSGYSFTGWSPSVSATVTGTITYTAQWRSTGGGGNTVYTVIFIDYNGTVLKTEQVRRGYSATAPANPSRAGYTFVGWNVDFSNVQSNLTVMALYTQNVITGGGGEETGGGGEGDENIVVVPVPPTPTTESPDNTEGNNSGNNPPITNIEDNQPPVAGPEPSPDKTWSLVNLIFTIAGLISAVITIIRIFVNVKKINEEGEGEKGKRSIFWIVVSLLSGIGGVILFLLTQSMAGAMVIVDKWTIVSAILLVFGITSQIFTYKKDRSNDAAYME